jgi:homoserine kinase type II
MSLAVLTPDEIKALSHWSIGELKEAVLPRGGTVNRTVLLETSTGSYVLRVCRKNKQGKDLQLECEVINHVLKRGLPALSPLLLPDSLPYLNLNQQLYLLFPKATGRQIARTSLSAKQLGAMGEGLARLTLALEDYPTNGIFRRTFKFDVDNTLEKLKHLEKRIRHFLNPGQDEKAALERIHQQRAFLQMQKHPINFEHMNFQVSHGDFHDGNLFFEGDKISAIIDWDQLRIIPRYFELLRTTSFLLSELEPKLVRVFVQSFLDNYPADKDELGATIKLYTLERAHNLWTLETIYREGNNRARVFLHGKFAETFKPFEDEWERLELKVN